jgi:hypothetical protein
MVSPFNDTRCAIVDYGFVRLPQPRGRKCSDAVEYMFGFGLNGTLFIVM